jgi:hypothetical protein
MRNYDLKIFYSFFKQYFFIKESYHLILLRDKTFLNTKNKAD